MMFQRGGHTGSLASCVVMEDFLEEGCLNCFLKNETELIRREMETGVQAKGQHELRQSALPPCGALAAWLFRHRVCR